MADLFPDGIRTGKIHYSNFLKRFLDLGFNNADCVNELIDNAIDAGAQNILIELVSNTQTEPRTLYLDVIDDGKGMDETGFDKYFEMFGDKDDLTLQSLGKKGIGGKVALVTLSKLNVTTVISKQKDDELRYSKVAWGRLREAGTICINHASTVVENMWNASPLGNVGHGTIARINLTSGTYDELDELISSDEITDRNIYYTVCRNYFRHLKDGLQISFSKTINNKQQVVLKCIPLDPLHLEHIENEVFKGIDVLQLYTNPLFNHRLEVLVRNNNHLIGFVQNKGFSHTLKPWSTDDVRKLEHIGELILQHSYIMFENEKDTNSQVPQQKSKEKHILERLFPGAKVTKEAIMPLTCGTHLERNRKETGLLLDHRDKKSGDYDKREFINQSRHRLIFQCTSNNDDVIDRVFQTQINKSKVDANEVPKIITKTVQKLNELFALKVYHAIESSQSTHIDTYAKVISMPNTSSIELINPSQLSKEKNVVINTPPKEVAQVIHNNKSLHVLDDKKQHASRSPATQSIPQQVASTSYTINSNIDKDEKKHDTATVCHVNDRSTLGVSEKALLYQIMQINEVVISKGLTKVMSVCSSHDDKDLVFICKYLEKFQQKLESTS